MTRSISTKTNGANGAASKSSGAASARGGSKTASSAGAAASADASSHEHDHHDHAAHDHEHFHDVHERNVCGPEEHARRGRDVVISDDQLERAAAIFRAAGDISRLKLLHRLSDGEWCVTELAEAANVGLSTVSQQLRLLRAERIVARRRAGKHIFYSLADAHVSDLIRSAIDHASESHTHAKSDDLADE
jgi:DNA-binding transcriptional ArsR family regulator